MAQAVLRHLIVSSLSWSSSGLEASAFAAPTTFSQLENNSARVMLSPQLKFSKSWFMEELAITGSRPFSKGCDPFDFSDLRRKSLF